MRKLDDGQSRWNESCRGVLDGAAILREVAATHDTQHIPIIVVTGGDAQGVSAASVLHKPCDPALLVAAVEQRFERAAA